MSKGLTRRKFIKGTLIGAGLVAGMGVPFGKQLMAMGAEQTNRGGVWKMAAAWTPPSLDVHRINMYWTSVGGMYDCLVGTEVDAATQELKLLPGLAKEWNYENDGKRLVMSLQKGVRFHDNSKFDAKVAKWNLDRVRQHPKSYMKTELKPVSDVKVLDDYTIAIELTAPAASLLYNLSDGRLWCGMVSQAFQEKFGDDELARKGCGTGPFRYKEWIVDQKVILTKNPDYWQNGADGKALPYLDGMEEHYRPQIDKAVVDLRSGALDTVFDPAARDVNAIKKDSNLEYIQLPPFEWQKICLGFNSRRGPFTSKSLRQAACFALDRKKIAKIMGFGLARPHMYPWITKGQPGWKPEIWPDYSYNPEKAEALLKQDYPKGASVELFSISREPDNTFAELVKAMWDKVGIKTKLMNLERLGWIKSMREDKYQAGFWNAATYMGGFIQPKLYSGAKGNWGQYKNPEVDKLLDEHMRTTDRAKRHELMAQALKIVYDAAELTSAYALTQAVGTNKKVKNLGTHFRYLNAEKVSLS